MVNPELIEILACPDSKQPVRIADTQLVEVLNKRIDKGTLKNKAGEVVQEKMEAGLIREDEKILYRIVDDIPVMLIEEGIPLDQVK
jgi:uncharacterized protein YbaR (Trm112 family)